MNKFKMFDGVRLTTSKYEKDGVPRDKVGAVLDICDNGIATGYTVEFSDRATGETILLNTFSEDELELVE